ncbi:MAG TPA: anhydro-N-acetylmuramic acid kinase [Alphaproteobacteria bacterium]|nr:anhydro-N-acetylmuramic acid kinase [Alphaproteobacteria bacterium]
MRRTAIGLMSGTSMDGVDVALIETDGLRVERCGGWTTRPYPEALRAATAAVIHDPQRAEHEPLDDLIRDLTENNAEAVLELLRREGLEAEAVDVVGFHGQTVLHRPERRFTRQLGDGALLARLTGIDVVNDFRSADVAAGGQGAPLAPLYHAALARGLDGPVAVLNLGGVGNVTVVDGERIVAFDTGPANALIDDWVRRHTGAAYDDGGRIAGAGTADPQRLAALLAHPYFAAPPPKSLDRNDFPVAAVEGLSLEDGAATLAAFTVASVAAARDHLPAAPRRWLVTGGGRHNATLMRGLAAALAVPVEPVEAVGWQGDALEAQAFAFLAVRSLDGLPLSLPTTTGVPRPLAGGVLHRRPGGGETRRAARG